ncbi:MAG: response regulator transcription factor [Thermodesulfobacteriota bacterium]|nr:response regulator transcription factor [Thermodesulfobacteriota bacterium]
MDEKKPSSLSKKPKVLIAEDNPVVSKGLTEFLNKWGYTPVPVDNGDDALQRLEEDHQIRLAIVDWNMPGLSGMQVCQRLRIRSGGPYVYIIMFSARKSKEEEILALDGGADDYLVKPCKPSELRARIGVGRRIIETALTIQMNQNTPTAKTDTDEKKSKKNDSGDAEKGNK